MIRKSLKCVAAILVLALAAYQPVYGATIASKMAENQSLAARTADVAAAGVVYGTEVIEASLAAEGLTADQIQARLAALSTADVISLTRNPAQLRSAGVTMSRKVWTIAGIAAGAVAAGAFALNQKDDGEDEDGVED